jgi:hypothetical protein
MGMEAKMKSTVALIAIVASIVFVDGPFTGGVATAASAQCAARCSDWCAKNAARINPTAWQRAVPVEAL